MSLSDNERSHRLGKHPGHSAGHNIRPKDSPRTGIARAKSTHRRGTRRGMRGWKENERILNGHFRGVTTYTPEDDMAFVGMPPIPSMIPEHDEIHVSCTFTWDKGVCEELAYQWEGQTNKKVRLGGPAYGSEA